MKYKLGELTKKYQEFACPFLQIVVEGKAFEKNAPNMIIGDITVELTCGCEASEAVFHIYHCTDEKNGEFLFEELKPYICLGSCVNIELGYGKVSREVFRGYIAKVAFFSEAEELPCVEVTVSDIKGMMMGGASIRQLKAVNYGDGVREILKKQCYQDMGKKGLIEKLKIEDTADKQDSAGKEEEKHIEISGESDYDFISRAANIYQYEFFTELGTLYFRKAKSDETVLISLGPDKGVLSMQTQYETRGFVQQVEIRGTSDGKGEVIAARKKSGNTLSFGNKIHSILSDTVKICVDPAVSTKEEAEERAKAVLEEIAWDFGEIQCKCIGIPEIRPGYFVELTGYGAWCDHIYYITQVCHTMSEDKGYCTVIRGRTSSVNSR